MSAELEARQIAAAAVLGDFRRELATTPLTRPPGREWMFRLADALESVLQAEADESGDEALADALDDGMEPYCRTCGEWAGMFFGMEGWHHFHGDPAPGGVRELYEAGHEAVIGWRAR